MNLLTSFSAIPTRSVPQSWGRGELGALCGFLRAAVRVDDELLRRAIAKYPVSLRCLVERDDLGVRDFAQVRHPVPQDRHHQLAVVFHDRSLSCRQRRRLDPRLAEGKGEQTLLGMSVLASGSASVYMPGMPIAPPARTTSNRVLSIASECSSPSSRP